MRRSGFAGARPLRIETGLPPCRGAIVRPHLDARNDRARLDHEIRTAHNRNLVRHPVEILLGELREQTEIKAREPLDALLRHTGDELLRLSVESNVSDWNQNMFGAEPAAGIDHRVVRDGLVHVEHEPFEFAELLARRVLDRIVFERHLRAVEFLGRNIPQTWEWMLHGRTSLTSPGARVRPDDHRSRRFAYTVFRSNRRTS